MCWCRFQPDRGFSGADQAPVRDGPVQFEKDTEEDPFGLNKFLTEAKKAKRPVEDRCVCRVSLWAAGWKINSLSICPFGGVQYVYLKNV